LLILLFIRHKNKAKTHHHLPSAPSVPLRFKGFGVGFPAFQSEKPGVMLLAITGWSRHLCLFPFMNAADAHGVEQAFMPAVKPD
jgi:hypothetical protein